MDETQLSNARVKYSRVCDRSSWMEPENVYGAEEKPKSKHKAGMVVK